MKKLLFLLAVAGVASSAFSQSTSSLSNVGLGVVVGDYLPTDHVLRDAFGSNIFTIGLAPVSFGRPNPNKLTPNFNIIGADQNGSNFLLIPVTMGYEFHFGDPTNTSFVPYARLDAGVSYFSFSVDTPGGKATGNDFGLVGAAEVGVELLKDVRLSAKYYLFSKENGINFNGVQVGLTIGIIHF